MKYIAVASLIAVSSLGLGVVVYFTGWMNGPVTVPDKCRDPRGLLLPCHCEHTDPDYVETYTLVCPKLDNEQQLSIPLANVLLHFAQTINAFKLDSSSFTYLPAGVFRGQKFKTVTFLNSLFTSLTDSDLAFVGLEGVLSSLILDRTMVQVGWDWAVLGRQSSIKTLEAYGGDIDSLDEVSEDSLLSPNRVVFEGNRIRTLHPRSFRRFRDLDFFVFSYNFIKTFERSMLPVPALKLREINLGYNEIENLPADAFTDMPALLSIGLESNKLLTLNEATFKPVVKQLNYIGVEMNDIDCDCRLLWIVGLNFYVYGYCAQPLTLRNRELSSLRDYELVC